LAEAERVRAIANTEASTDLVGVESKAAQQDGGIAKWLRRLSVWSN
jgi:hypothetical protein